MANLAVPQPEPLAPVIPVEGTPARAPWSLPLRILFRFVFCYFVLYCAPQMLNSVPGLSKLGAWNQRFWRTLTPWVAIHQFHLSGRAVTYFLTGSGDTTLAYIQNLLYAILALAATLLWSVLDRRRRDYRALHGWLRILLRYSLALIMFSYGFAKVFPLQFRTPGFSKLVEPFGEFSPMGVLWTFMGASVPYTIFSGAIEVLGGSLLLFRRTATLGALVSGAALLNIVLLNFCYDVPVKLYSSNLLLMAICLAAPDLRRLLALLVLNRPVPAADLGALPLPRPSWVRREWMRWAAVGVKALFIGYILFFQIKGGWSAYRQVRSPELPPLYGLYDVEVFKRNGRELPPLLTDTTRWRRVIVQLPGALTIRGMDDSPATFTAVYAKDGKTVTLSQGNGPRNEFTYSRPDAGHVLLEGALTGDQVSIRLKKVDTSRTLLLSRGFHWINELPFNR